MHEDLESSLLKCFLKALGEQLPSLPRYHLRPSLDSMFRPAVRVAAVEPSSPHASRQFRTRLTGQLSAPRWRSVSLLSLG